MIEKSITIKNDFDRLAPLAAPRWTHNNHYYPELLRFTPPQMENALDIGCGNGEFSRLLAERANHVLAIDLSPKMIESARLFSSGYANIEYRSDDVMDLVLAPQSFDCIASIATLHHLALDSIYPRLARALKPGGWLLVLDLYKQSTLLEYASSLLAIPYKPGALRAQNRSPGTQRRRTPGLGAAQPARSPPALCRDPPAQHGGPARRPAAQTFALALFTHLAKALSV